jgi:hypothetical protein
MTYIRFAPAALLLALAPLGLAAQRPAPPPAPAPAPAPAQDPAAREQAAKRAEAERKAQEQREQAERERVKNAREQAKEKGKDAAPVPAAAPNNEMRDAARNLFALERTHRERLARIERLMALFREKGDQAKLLELEQMRAKENKRYGRFLERYIEEMGPAFEKVQGELLGGQQRRERSKGAEEKPAPQRARENKPVENKEGGQ